MPTVHELYDAADALKEQGDLEGAVAKLREILAIEEANALTHSALAVHLQKLGRYEEAVKHAQRVTEIEPNDPFSYTQLSVICQRCGLIQAAEDAMAKSREVSMRSH